MKLIWAKVDGFKRFEESSTINLENKVVAIVGPNEAGKTSLIEALDHMDNGKDFAIQGLAQDLTRGRSRSGDDVVVEVAYFLDEDDRSALSEIRMRKRPEWLHRTKCVNNRTFWELKPDPARDISLRVAASHALQRMSKRRWYRVFTKMKADLAMVTTSALEVLGSAAETLSDSEIDAIRSLQNALKDSVDSTHPKYAQQFLADLDELIEIEGAEHPSDAAYAILSKRRPHFLFFSNDDRTLEPFYGIKEDQADFPVALGNLAQLAGMNLLQLRNAMNNGDQGRIETIVQNANSALRDFFATNWSQSGVSPHLSVNGRGLHILVNHSEGDSSEITSIAERSDGLRRFVALVAFVAKQNGAAPILLMDEVENHLHYDAQADLVQMLSKQEAASKVIYTTHSIGCLPEDLGSGVRLVEAASTNNRSIVRNWFWTEGPGFYPLLYGMGAAMMAFIPLRYSLLTEGITDMLLLPQLFREASSKDYIGFQVAPGLSSSDHDQIARLDKESPRTVYLVDSDAGGRALHDKLNQCGIPDDRIFHISSDPNLTYTIEDMIDPTAFCNSVNLEIKRWQNSDIELSPKLLPNNARMDFLSQWLRDNGLKEIAKRSLAGNLLENRNGGRLLFSDRKSMLSDLLLSIQAALKIT